MSIWRLIRDKDNGQGQVNDADMALVEAASESAARTAAEAIQSDFPAGYWDDALAEDLEAAPYLGGVFTVVQDDGF